MFDLLTQIKHRNFQRLWFAQLISQFGDRIHQLALVGMIAERSPGSTIEMAKILACTIIPVFIVQPFAGVLVDRWDRKVTLFICDIIRGLLVLMIPLIFFYWQNMIPIYIIVLIAFCFPRFYVPAKMSIIPQLVHEENLLKANSLITTTGMIAAGLGAALGAFIIEYYGSRVGFLIDAATFFVSAIFLANINFSKEIKINRQEIIQTGKDLVGAIKKSIWIEMREGFQYVLQHAEIRFVIYILSLLFAAVGAIYVVMIVFVQNVFKTKIVDLGALAICLVAGLFLGVVVYGKYGKKVRWYLTIFSCLILGGIMLAVFAHIVSRIPSLPLAMILAFFLGGTIGPIFIACNTVVHTTGDVKKHGQIFSMLEIVTHAAFLITMFSTAWLSKKVGEGNILCSVGWICVLAGVVGFLLSKQRKLS